MEDIMNYRLIVFCLGLSVSGLVSARQDNYKFPEIVMDLNGVAQLGLVRQAVILNLQAVQPVQEAQEDQEGPPNPSPTPESNPNRPAVLEPNIQMVDFVLEPAVLPAAAQRVLPQGGRSMFPNRNQQQPR